MKIEDNISLADFTTFHIGGKARKFVTVHSIEELKEAAKYARKNKHPIFALGSGSNILVSDAGFPGLVIQMAIGGIGYGNIAEKSKQENRLQVSAGAGVIWNDFVLDTVKRGLFGLENLAGIPGTVGAAPIQNIGAYGSELKDTLVSLKVFDTETMEIQVFTKDECKFGYRDSLFKKVGKSNLIVVEITVELKKDGQANTSYPDLAKYFAEKNSVSSAKSASPISPLEVYEAVIAIRKAKLPDPAKLGTAGSFFKNPIILTTQFSVLQKKFANITSFPANDGNVKISAAWLIDKACGLKGFREGNVGTYPNQPLAIVSYGNASAKEVANFAQMVKDTVKEKTGIELEWEVQKVGA